MSCSSYLISSERRQTWYKEVQRSVVEDRKFDQVRSSLSLFTDEKGILKCGGRLKIFTLHTLGHRCNTSRYRLQRKQLWTYYLTCKLPFYSFYTYEVMDKPTRHAFQLKCQMPFLFSYRMGFSRRETYLSPQNDKSG